MTSCVKILFYGTNMILFQWFKQKSQAFAWLFCLLNESVIDPEPHAAGIWASGPAGWFMSSNS